MVVAISWHVRNVLILIILFFAGGSLTKSEWPLGVEISSRTNQRTIEKIMLRSINKNAEDVNKWSKFWNIVSNAKSVFALTAPIQSTVRANLWHM